MTLEVDDVRSAPVSDVAPRPDVRPPIIDREKRTVTLSWPSVKGAVYDVYGWDPKEKKPILLKENVMATGDSMAIHRLMEEEGIFWVVLKSSPKAPTQSR